MKARGGAAVAAVTLCVGLMAACSEEPQVLVAKKSDSQAYQGTGTPYAAGEWKAGDAASWEQQMRTRAQGQDEYSRAAAQ
jgi:hypothetical protein